MMAERDAGRAGARHRWQFGIPQQLLPTPIPPRRIVLELIAARTANQLLCGERGPMNVAGEIDGPRTAHLVCFGARSVAGKRDASTAYVTQFLLSSEVFCIIESHWLSATAERIAQEGACCSGESG